MAGFRAFVTSTVVLGIVALVHAMLTWPIDATIALFVGGATVAFVAEAIVIHLGWVDHAIGPKAIGVPIYVLFGWTATIYFAFRVALLVTAGWVAVLLAAGLATGYDILVDYRGVEDGHWTYTDELPGPRFREVPWWNFVGWFMISGVTAGIASLFM